MYHIYMLVLQGSDKCITYEPRHEKTGFLHMPKLRRKSVVR